MSHAVDGLLQQINKRFTLNLLIQGSAEHAFLTSHYLVRDELAAIHPDLLHRYDQLSTAACVQYWRGEGVLLLGSPSRFWQRASKPGHPFCDHPLLSRHGRSLARAAQKRAHERGRAKNVTRVPGLFSLQQLRLSLQVAHLESKHRPALVQLAKEATYRIWGLPIDRMDAALTASVEFGRLTPAKTFRDTFLRAGAAGYGGVLRKNSELRVVAKAWVWPLLSHELVKGTVELICLYGLNELDSRTYKAVLKVTDRIEYETWMLQAGSELWRRLLPLLPDYRPVSEMVMHMARLPPRSLDRLMLAVVEEPQWAWELLDALGRDEAGPP